MKRSHLALSPVAQFFTILFFALTATTAALAQGYVKFYDFTVVGAGPMGGLSIDSGGNLYGTTTTFQGTVFRFDPNLQYSSLFTFNGGSDGDYPYAAPIGDGAGNLYGTTGEGGTGGAYGGVVYEVSPAVGGGWRERVIYNFSGGSDGSSPRAQLITDSSGNLYGTTVSGGAYGAGTVFELKSNSGAWQEKVLHSFGSKQDGASPYCALTFDSAGNLYGTTVGGGKHGDGTVFQLVRGSSGQWKERVLYSFAGTNKHIVDGKQPYGGVVIDAAGNVYGTLWEGGAYAYDGAIFELSPQLDGSWTESLIYSFRGAVTGYADGALPYGPLYLDQSGSLHGTTYEGGDKTCLIDPYGCGTVFKLTFDGSSWQETVLHEFGSGTDGAHPNGGLVSDALGNLYGTTSAGGAHSAGTAFKVTP
jgi:uncharacterized repeat protein (TIGR03803 family)